MGQTPVNELPAGSAPVAASVSTPPAAVPLRLASPVSAIDGVGPAIARRLRRLDIRTISDLIRHVPMRYERQFAEGTIRDLPMDGLGTARGIVVATRIMGAGGGRGGGQRFQATLRDHSDTLALVWFNAGYLRKSIHPGMKIRVTGKVKAFNGYPQMVNAKWEPLEEGAEPGKVDDRLRPIYPATEDLPSAKIEQLMAEVLPRVTEQLVDPLPADFCRPRNMPALAQAFAMIHQPADEEEAGAARRRLAYNELLLLQMGIALKRHYNQTMLQAPALRFSAAIDKHIRQRFPFALTKAQERVIGELAGDLAKGTPMNRLLQGDVGSGKTVVALYALLLAVANRRQGAIMTPTELLAEQHFLSISRMLEGSNVRLALLTGSRRGGAAQRAELMRQIAAGEIDIVVGTQALLTETVRFNELAVVVIDEQHRFGVLQRAAFRQDKSEWAGKAQSAIAIPGKSVAPRKPASPVGPAPPTASPHYLVMTATPIPRTLSLTVFGDLDVSVIDELPPGRSPIVTRVVAPAKSDDVYQYLARRCAGGEQAYVVLPAIEGADEDSPLQLKNVLEHERLLRDKYCRGLTVEAIHGRLKTAEREAIMARFRENKTQVLVATTVIEVGVDVPNATLMVIEHAERFGLAQLHQLRGRIGRGAHKQKSVCVLISDPVTEESQKRLAAIAASTDGFRIAEADLEIRGMGDFFGTRQHGLPPLRVAAIPQDMELLRMARRDAAELVREDPDLTGESHRALRAILLQQYGQTLGLIDVG